MDTQMINKYKWLHIYGRGFDSRRLHQINKKGCLLLAALFYFSIQSQPIQLLSPALQSAPPSAGAGSHGRPWGCGHL